MYILDIKNEQVSTKTMSGRQRLMRALFDGKSPEHKQMVEFIKTFIEIDPKLIFKLRFVTDKNPNEPRAMILAKRDYDRFIFIAENVMDGQVVDLALKKLGA